MPPHYTPLLGAEAAQRQVTTWWSEAGIRTAVESGLVVVAEAGGAVVGVGERGRFAADHVIYKLYVHPEHRGRGLGPRLIAALIATLPAGTDSILLEHFAANTRAADFYEREGFAVQHVDPAPDGDARLDVVWRRRRLIR